MEQLRIQCYTDEKYSMQYGEVILLCVDTESLKVEKGIVYQEDKQQGTTNATNVFEKYKPEKFSFDFIVDTTGVIEGTQRGDKVQSKIEIMEKSLYLYNSEGHRPSYAVIAFGELMFKGQLSSMSIKYSLFNHKGIPLRAKGSVSFLGFRGSEEDKKRYSKLSPDMSRLVVLKESDTLAALCHQIYGNSLLVNKVARFNNLNGFRDIPAGTEILFPPLKKS